MNMKLEQKGKLETKGGQKPFILATILLFIMEFECPNLSSNVLLYYEIVSRHGNI